MINNIMRRGNIVKHGKQGDERTEIVKFISSREADKVEILFESGRFTVMSKDSFKEFISEKELAYSDLLEDDTFVIKFIR